MAHFTCLIGNRISVMEAAFVSQPFPTKEAADAYKRQLEAHWHLPPSDDTAPPVRTRKRRRVRCWQEGMQPVFDSVADAARAIGVSPPAIFRHLKEPHKFNSVRGFTFSWHDENETTTNHEGTR